LPDHQPPSSRNLGDRFFLGTDPVHRLGHGAMQLAGPGVIGPPPERLARLEAIGSGG
jgi:hypothetical protein